jgi:zinc transport system permease protein
VNFLIDNPFLQMALYASLLASFAGGVMGPFVVVKRIVFIAGSISHSVLAGIGLCVWLQKVKHVEWAHPIVGGLLAAIGSAWIIGWIHLNYRQREDALIGAIWSTGTAIGVIFIALTPGNSGQMMDVLFGNILWIRPQDLFFLAGLDLLLLGVVALNYQKFLAICFDEEQAVLQAVAVRKLYLLLLTIVAITIVLLVQIIGTILGIALLTIPATLAGLFTKKLSTMMFGASLLCALFCYLGLSASHTLDWPPGATIALIAAVGYLLALVGKRKLARG